MSFSVIPPNSSVSKRQFASSFNITHLCNSFYYVIFLPTRIKTAYKLTFVGIFVKIQKNGGNRYGI